MWLPGLLKAKKELCHVVYEERGKRRKFTLTKEMRG
jgi:hypothetical protein